MIGIFQSWAGFAGLRRRDGSREDLELKPILETRFLDAHGFIDCPHRRGPEPIHG